MSGSYTGEGARLQIGKGTTWKTAVAPTTEIDMTDESFGEEPNVITEETLVGKATAGRSDVMGKKVPGGFGMLVKADNIGLILACALGSESAVSSQGSGVYQHDFSLITGSASMLPMFTAVVDKRTSVKGYASNKVATLTLDQANNDYLKATVETIGTTEASDTLESLTLSTLRAFNFNDLQVKIDDVAVTEIKSVTATLTNNLEDDLFVADGSSYMIEIDRQRREFTIDMEALWDPTIETQRDDKYLGNTAVKVELIWTGELAATGLYYSLTVTCLNMFYTSAKPVISGPERITIPLSLRAASIGSDEPVVITLQDMQATRYLA